MTAGIAIRGLLQMVPRFLWCLLQFHSIPGKQTKSWFGARLLPLSHICPRRQGSAWNRRRRSTFIFVIVCMGCLAVVVYHRFFGDDIF